MSTLLTRYLEPAVRGDLKEKMVFIGGPRQVGKTTFAQNLIHQFKEGNKAYINWDNPQDKKRFLEKDWPPDEPLIVFDEIHKYKRWNNMVKGYWDSFKKHQNFIVTGSARLDCYRRGGDSLLGRYHYYRMHPLSLNEIHATGKDMEHILTFGGFPECFLKGSERYLRRWHRERISRIISMDIRDLEYIREISLMELLIEALPERVGSPLSKKKLALQLEVDFKTITRWLTILENMYYCYLVSPFGAARIRAVKKEQKLYLWDWSEHEDPGKRWENFVASHLLKYCHFLQDSEGYKMELRFLRDVDGREIDFVVIKNKKPLFAVECKTGERALSPHLFYFRDRTDIPKFYQVHQGKKYMREDSQIEMIPFVIFARQLEI